MKRCLPAMTVLLLTIPAFARAEPEDPSAIAGRRAMQRGGSSPWYDAQKDSVRRIQLPDAPPPPAPTQPPPPRTTRPPAPPPAQTTAPPPAANSQPAQASPSSSTSGVSEVFKYLAWTLIVLALAALVYLLIRAFMKHEQRLASQSEKTVEITGTQADRVERLPVPVRRPLSDLLSEAKYHYENGNFREAIIYLYSHELVELDKQQVIHLARGKTNRQYLRELKARHRLREVLEQTMVVFEDAFFGKLDIGRERFESCWNRLADFDALLTGAAA